jgi:hypothetical protein
MLTEEAAGSSVSDEGVAPSVITMEYERIFWEQLQQDEREKES